ncbi:MAG: neutral/alkaline non-lysosomal ceramidase N-terminal domain-containing protein [Candidatus Hydrogenedentes bacterium]|nr:neutral/alkaline non-lysosomal ceramidase N-terminal domain-containing protein [Candidatus Hydrogenedentota bacterium]
MQRITILILTYLLFSTMLTSSVNSEILAGSSKISINPFPQGLNVQLGGYGERAGKPAEGVHDTTYAKALVLHDPYKNQYLFIITADICHIPWSVVKHTVAKAKLPYLNEDNLVIMASHTHAGLEGMSLDERNILQNQHIGIFDPKMLEFITSQLAILIKDSLKELHPVTFSSKAVEVVGLNKNRRNDKKPVDSTLNILRFDRNGAPWVIFVNYTAHETIMTPKEMLLSAGYPGIIQRIVEAFYPGSTCMFSNGAEGDVAPAGYSGSSAWEKMENYGIALSKVTLEALESMSTNPITSFNHEVLWVELPPKELAPDFLKIAGDEYRVPEEVARSVISQLFPDKAPIHGIRINSSAIITFPGEPISAIGLAVKQRMREKNIEHPVVVSLTNDLIGYILTEEEYSNSGYEVTASFYGSQLGALITQSAYTLIDKLAD